MSACRLHSMTTNCRGADMIDFMLDKIMNTYTFESQREIFVEECAEAIKAAQKMKRAVSADEFREAVDNFCEEVADVCVMAEQMRRFCGAEKIDKIISRKLQRQIERIE